METWEALQTPPCHGAGLRLLLWTKREAVLEGAGSDMSLGTQPVQGNLLLTLV